MIWLKMLFQGSSVAATAKDRISGVNELRAFSSCDIVVEAIVNIGCDIAKQRIATPNDIDDAVCLGLGYPMGPLALGDELGPPMPLTMSAIGY